VNLKLEPDATKTPQRILVKIWHPMHKNVDALLFQRQQSELAPCTSPVATHAHTVIEATGLRSQRTYVYVDRPTSNLGRWGCDSGDSAVAGAG
jgi:hypothetical protein